MFTDNTPSLADIAAVTRDNDGFGGGSWGWFFIILLILCGGGFGGNGFGIQRGNFGNYATSAEVYDATNIQSTTNRLNDIVSGIGNVNYNMANQTNAIQQSMNAGFNSVNNSISDLAHHLDTCCCEIKTNLLQNKYDDVRYQLEQANTAVANAVQTQNILGTIGQWYSKPAVNPYFAYGFGCNGFNNGTTIV